MPAAVVVEYGCRHKVTRLVWNNIRIFGKFRTPITVDYYITLNSPFTYLGCALLAEIAQRNNATVNIKPGKFGPIFEQTGGLPLPKRSPQRRAYRMMELKRWGEVRGIQLTLEPKYFPCDETAATRLVIAASCKGMMPLNCPWNSGARFGNGRSLSPIRQRSHRPQSELVSTPQSYVRTARWTPNSTTYMISIRKKR